MQDNQKVELKILNDIYGTSQLYNLVAEECSELSRAVMKMQRIESGDPSVRIKSNQALMNIDEEIADVLICIERLQEKLDNRERVNFFINKKINRSLEIIRKMVEKEGKN